MTSGYVSKSCLQLFHGKWRSHSEQLSLDLIHAIISTCSSIKAEQINDISLATLRSITPCPKCAALYGDWLQDCTKMGTTITKDSIIKVVSKLETNPELQLTQPKNLPPFLATTLNLPHYMEEVNTAVHLVDTTNTPKSTKYSSRPQSKDKNTQRNGRTPPPSPANGTRRNTSDRTQPRRTSKSPNKHESYDVHNRGRSDIPKSEQLRSVQYPSIFSKNTTQRKQSLPTLFSRPLTPNTDKLLSQVYFITTLSPSKFKDVHVKGKCIRCYGPSHWAASCPRFTSPCSHPCRYCKYLYHPTSRCPYFETN